MSYLIAAAALIVVMIVTAILYLKAGWFKWFYHGVLGWHEPKDEEKYDGCSYTSVCKYCGKRIMQDSQGNWFEVGDIDYTGTERRESE